MNEQTFVGTLVPVRTAVVASPAERQIVGFLAMKGSCVKAAGKKGAIPLARLRTNEVATDIAGAVAELDFRQHELDEAKLSAPRESEQAKARKDAAEAVMNFAQSRWKRAQKPHHFLRAQIAGAFAQRHQSGGRPWRFSCRCCSCRKRPATSSAILPVAGDPPRRL